MKKVATDLKRKKVHTASAAIATIKAEYERFKQQRELKQKANFNTLIIH